MRAELWCAALLATLACSDARADGPSATFTVALQTQDSVAVEVSFDTATDASGIAQIDWRTWGTDPVQDTIRGMTTTTVDTIVVRRPPVGMTDTWALEARAVDGAGVAGKWSDPHTWAVTHRDTVGPAPPTIQIPDTVTVVGAADPDEEPSNTGAADGGASDPGVTDPTLLPAATGQSPQLANYPGASLSAGESYADPVTGVRVYKVTDPSFPGASERATPDYAEGGPLISQGWTAADGGTRYTLHIRVRDVQTGNDSYFVDFDPEAGTFSNIRRSPVRGNQDLSWAFSYNPETPRIGYYLGGSSTIQRYNTATDSDANIGNFPAQIPGFSTRMNWLHIDYNDRWFTYNAADNSQGGAWDSQTDVVRGPYSPNGYDEPHLLRSGDFLLLSGRAQFPGGFEANSYYVVRLSDGAQIAPVVAHSHTATLDGYAVQTDPNGSIFLETRYDPSSFSESDPDIVVTLDGEELAGSGHRAGQWSPKLGNDPGMRQWYLFSNWGGAALALDHGIAFVRADGSDIRLLVHHYSDVGDRYYHQPHATMSPDGRIVMWGSDMGGTGRVDVFLAVVPSP